MCAVIVGVQSVDAYCRRGHVCGPPSVLHGAPREPRVLPAGPELLGSTLVGRVFIVTARF